ncbi:MAG: hypothetical protein ACKVP1_01035 [Burkholderiaceae bacterium]
MTPYDSIIVGVGSVGCVLANRLTANGKRNVLLLEASPRDTIRGSMCGAAARRDPLRAG